MRPMTLVWAAALTLFSATSVMAFPVTFGDSWDDVPLQQILDDLYGPGVVNAATDYEGAQAGDAMIPYWEDEVLDGIIVTEIAGYRYKNTMGWYVETEGLSPAAAPAIDGIDDGVVFSGPMVAGQTVSVTFPGGVTKFGLYLNPNGELDATNAPEGEYFFTNRFLNDVGIDGVSPVNHQPNDGDPQALIYNVTHLHNGIPTFIVAWEDLDYGSPISPSFTPTTTDNDYNDLVVRVTASSPVPVESTSWGKVKGLYQR